MQQPKELKELPSIPSKQKIMDMYWQLPRDYVKRQINTILEADGESKHRRCLNHKQFKELIDILGIPKGYRYEES